MSYFIVEHPTRGVFMGYSDDTVAAKPKFNHIKSRAQCKRYATLEEASIRAIWSGMPSKCFVVEMPGGKIIPVAPEPRKQGAGWLTGRIPSSKPLESARPSRPDVRAREAALRKALIVCLRELPGQQIIDVLADNWATLDRIDELKARFP